MSASRFWIEENVQLNQIPWLRVVVHPLLNCDESAKARSRAAHDGVDVLRIGGGDRTTQWIMVEWLKQGPDSELVKYLLR